MFHGSRGAGVRRTHPIRGGFGSDDVSHFFTCTCNLHLSPLAESAPLVLHLPFLPGFVDLLENDLQIFCDIPVGIMCSHLA
jgi:hypothetical protein